MGLKRVKVLAEVLGVHPAVIVFPDYEAPVKKTRSGTSSAVRRFTPVAGAAPAMKKAAKAAAPTRPKKVSSHA
jgi:hypothetical protein